MPAPASLPLRLAQCAVRPLSPLHASAPASPPRGHGARRPRARVARRSSRPRESSRAGRSPLLLAPCCKMNCPPPLPPSAWPPGPIREWRFPARRGCEAPLLRGCSPARRPPPPRAHVAPARPRPAFPARLPLAAAARPRPRRSPRKRATSCPSFFRGARMYALWTTIGFQSKTIADFRVPSTVTCPRFRYPLPWRTR